MSKEQELKAKCLEMALVAAAEAVESSWSEMWKARNRAVKDGKDDYTLSLSVGIKDKGDGKANVGCEFSWSEKHKGKIADKEINVAEAELNFDQPAQSEEDKLVDEAWEIVKTTGRASTSAVQRRLHIGFTAAARLMDVMEEKGWIGPPNGDEPREILRKDEATELAEG